MTLPRLVLLAVAFLLAACASEPPPAASCATPRQAADSLLAWQHNDHFDLDQATRCVDARPEARNRLAVQLKQVLDARGLYVPVDDLPDEPDHTNAQGEARVQPLAQVPVVLERADDGRWVYSAETMRRVPELYRQTFSPWVEQAQSALPAPFFGRFAGLFVWQWAFAGVLLLAAWVIGRLVRVVLHGRVLQVARRIGIELDRAAWRETDTPLMLTAFFGVLWWGLPQLQLPIEVSRFAVAAANVGLSLSGIWLTWGLVDVLAAMGLTWATTTDSKLDDQLIPLLRSGAQTVVVVLGFFVVLGALGVDVWKLVAGVSVGGLIVGLAAQDTVKNVFGSLNVFIDRPFQIGDWVQMNGVEGIVEEVGFRSTRVRTFHNSQVTVPNSTITNANVDNFGRRARRRCKFVVGLTYDTPPDLLAAYAEGVRAILAAHPHVEKSYEVHVWDLGASSIEILVYYHLVVPDWTTELETRAQNLLEFIRLAADLGVSFAFPSTSVYVEATPDAPLPERPPTTVEELGALLATYGPGGDRARPDGPAFPERFDPASVAARDGDGT